MIRNTSNNKPREITRIKNKNTSFNIKNKRYFIVRSIQKEIYIFYI
jgi:hypothetical protein